MLRLVTLILHLTYSMSTTKPFVTFYWQTTSVTDKVFDYWNHGPIYIPGFQNVYTLTTRPLDVFPPWLTRSTTPSSIFRSTKNELSDKKTVMLTKQTVTPAKITEITKVVTEAKPTETQTTEAKPTKKDTNATHRPKQITLPSFEEVENQGPTDPFSAFLRKFLKVLSVKSHSELPSLFRPFSSYMTELIKEGDFKGLGDVFISFANSTIEKLNGLILTPDKLRTQCYQGYNMLANRYTALHDNTNNLLNFLDDLYVEAEEEIMMIVLNEATKFPNTNTTAEEIAYSFVNNVFLIPMTRINGTSRGDDLVNMLTRAITQNKEPLRRSFGKTHRKKRSRNFQPHKTEKKYKTIRDNMENINNLIGKFKLDISSSDTSAYEYEIGGDVDETEKRKQIEDTIKKTKDNQIQIFKSISEGDSESLSENEQVDKETPNFRGIIDNLERLFSVDKTSGFPEESTVNFRFGSIDKYLNKEHTVLVPSHSLLTKLVKKRIPYDATTSPRKKHKTSRHSYFTDDRPEPTTKASKKLDHKGSTIMSQIKKEKKAKNVIKTYFNKHPLNIQTINYPVRQNKPELKNKPTARIPLKQRPALDIEKRLKTITLLQSLKVITVKPSSNSVTKQTNETDIISKILNILRNERIKMPKKIQNITQHNMNDNISMDIKENADESDDSDTYTEYSSESSGQKASKYKKLKRKYNILKRLSEQILAQKLVKHERTTPKIINVLREKVDEKAFNNRGSEGNNDILETATDRHRKIKINNINLFLNDYDGQIEFESDSEPAPQTNKVDNRDIIRKSFPLSRTTDNITTTEYSEAEKELKQYLYDAIRHMDFVNFNASRRHDDVEPIVGPYSYETDVEAVLKTNIYKAVKNLLKT